MVDTSRGQAQPQRGGPHWNDPAPGQDSGDPYGQPPPQYGQQPTEQQRYEQQRYEQQQYEQQRYEQQRFEQQQSYDQQRYEQQRFEQPQPEGYGQSPSYGGQPGYQPGPPPSQQQNQQQYGQPRAGGYGTAQGYGVPQQSNGQLPAPTQPYHPQQPGSTAGDPGYRGFGGQPVRQPGYAPPSQQPYDGAPSYGAPSRGYTAPVEAYQPPNRSGFNLDGSARHAATGPEDPRLRGAIVRTPPMRRKGWQWLLIIPGVLPLLVPFYNHIEPTLWGIPFFFWYQMACGVAASVIITFVYLVTRGRN